MPGAAMEHRLHSLVRRVMGDTRSDADLLARIRDDHDAFAELVSRHGPLVWGVCRHMLGEADAEDAFQATFLALLRSTVRDAAALASWLHGVAVRVSLAARREAGRRRVRERAVAAPETISPRKSDDWEDTMAVVHREVAALPEADRSAFILCVLGGLTQAEAAARLGRTPGVIAGQVARSKKRLVARLTGRGVVPGLVALGTASVAGAVPPGVVERVLGLPGAGVPPAVLQLTRGVMGMTASSPKMILAAVTMAAGLAAGVLAATAGPLPETTRPEPAPAGVRRPDLSDVQFQPEIRPDLSGAQFRPEVKKAEDDTPGRPVRSLLGHKDRVTSVAYSPDGKSVATIAFDGTARIWDATTGKEERCLVVRSHPTQIMFSPDNEFIVTVQQIVIQPSVVAAWNRRTGEKVREFSPTKDPRTEAEQVRASGLNKCAAFSPDGKHLACGGCETSTNAGADILIYEFATGKLVREMRGQQRRIESLTFSPDGKTLFSQGPLHQPKLLDGGKRLVFDHVVRVWDVATGKERRSVLAGLGVEHLALSPDGRTLVHANGNAITLRETATGGERARLTGHTGDVRGFAISPDGRTLASAGGDGTVRLWDLPSGKEVGRLEGNDEVLAAAFSPDGRTLVSGGLDQTAHIWDVSKITGRPRVLAERSAAELEADWKDLGGDAAKGYAALGRLVSSPVSAVPFLGVRLEAAVAAAADTKPIERLIAALADEDFQLREQATKELRAMGDRAAPSLRKALAADPSPESRKRLGDLLARIDGTSTSAETAREVRTVEALEAVGTPEARRLLDTLAAGPAGMRLTQEAKASADRLTKRSPVPAP